MGITTIIEKRSQIIVGQNREEKLKKAMKYVSEYPIIIYANEYDIEDNFSIPINVGIIIEEVDYKANVDLIKKTIIQYRGQVVLLSSNQKDVPKTLFNLCQLRRASAKPFETELKELAPRSERDNKYKLDMFPLVRQYLINSDREEVSKLLKLNTPPDIQILSWLAPNVHPNKLMFVDSQVKRKWDKSYFYELLAYSHDGKIHRKMSMPTRKAYSKIPNLLVRIGLKKRDVYLFSNLKQDKSLVLDFQKKLNNGDCRLLSLGEKKRKTRYAKIIPKQLTLEDWL
tara:strand:+ start:2995 stop:3846 length:852 start_codon:yes stop_codon:yes gene_type:complete